MIFGLYKTNNNLVDDQIEICAAYSYQFSMRLLISLLWPTDLVLEIGPGAGNLTQLLLERVKWIWSSDGVRTLQKIQIFWILA